MGDTGLVTATPGNFSAPLPIAWDPGRDARGASTAPNTPRCPVPACPVRFADGTDRPCRLHREQEDEIDPRPLAMARVQAGPRDPRWPRIRELSPSERARLDGDPRNDDR